MTSNGTRRRAFPEHWSSWLFTIRPCTFAVALLVFISRPAFSDEHSSPTNAVRAMELRGRVVCLAEELHRLHGALLPTDHQHLWGFKTPDGTQYTLLRSKFSEAIFLDERIRQKELLLKAKLFPRTQVVEVTVIRSIRGGAVQDLYYYCDVCAIKSVSPEVCACCQAPVVLTEKPLSEREE